MNLSNMQIIKTSIADAEHYKTYHDIFLSTHLTVIVIPQIEQDRYGIGAGGVGGQAGESVSEEDEGENAERGCLEERETGSVPGKV